MDKAEDIISEIFGSKLDGRLTEIPHVLKNWKKILIDERLADHCKFEDVTENQLVVSFDHQGWIQVFKMQQRQILSNFNRYFKGDSKITSVRMLMRADIESYRSSGKNRKVREISKEEREYSAPASIESIQDSDLRQGLENLRKKLQGK